jgi:hydrogenase expression/formation protein HypD
MKFITEFRDKALVEGLIKEIRKVSRKDIALMEVCGGHTMAIHKFGIPAMLPENIRLLSGPGCPVCVTDKKYIDIAVHLSRMPDVIITTYGDLIRVPGSQGTLDLSKSEGNDVRIVYSSIDALQIARENPSKKVVFLGIGFETTAPGTAVAISNAYKEGLKNFYVHCSHKIMPPAMEALITEGVRIDGYICPGHVSAITGSGIYDFIPDRFKLGCVIAGFEPTDILQSILMLVKQIENNDTKVEIAYKRAVKPEGNLIAKAILTEVFELGDDWWRGFGVIPQSGLKIRQKYAAHNVEGNFDITVPEPAADKGCVCGEILKGLKKPVDCKLFRKVCTPENPIGACMVSNEGACAAFFRYGE